MRVLHDDFTVKCLKLHEFVHQAATKTFVEWTNTVTGKGSLVTRVNDPTFLPLFCCDVVVFWNCHGISGIRVYQPLIILVG
jgi:hypothetical protein